MTQIQSDLQERFEDEVALKFQLYNSLFLSLPFHGIEKTGALLTLFGQVCESGFEKGSSPKTIIERFFADNTTRSNESDRLNMLFRFVQYAERQVVLFDAIEDASFRHLHDMRGIGTLKHLTNAVKRGGKTKELEKRLEEFGIRLVLTAHPTQFYPGFVLGIINDLSQAIEKNDTPEVKLLLQQLGRTPFFKKEKPTPYDEALALIWYLEYVFYPAVGEIVGDLEKAFPLQSLKIASLIKMGFWSGGDRDGNPYVTVETTRKTAAALRKAILRCYHRDLKQLRRRLTFSGLENLIDKLEIELYENSHQKSTSLSKQKLLDALGEIKQTIDEKHDGLFVHLIEHLIAKVEIFGIAIASLDIRQDSSVHTAICNDLSSVGILPGDFNTLSAEKQLNGLMSINTGSEPESFEDPLTADTFATIREVHLIQQLNGHDACSRYIISHTQTAVDVARVFGLFLASGWKPDELSIDITPLFETVEDLQNAAGVMRELYNNSIYRAHLQRRGNTQTVMLGFSDGTKDGGYLMANYGIYRAKKELTETSREFGIDIIFFDGRGGPPARGGGKTHRFYSSMGNDISNRSLELTVQGQTVSSNFGTIDAARYNIEQLLHAGTYGPIFNEPRPTFTEDNEVLLDSLAKTSFEAYCELKTDPAFLNYLENATPLRYFARANIGSRPAKRGGKDAKLTLDSLRAIPFVGSWSQMKQNVPGFYGVGTALRIASENGDIEAITSLYKTNQFFRALIDNCEMAMQKTFLPLTAHLSEDKVFGSVWRKIRDEYELCGKFLAIVTDNPTLMTDFPVSQQSVRMREGIVQPLTAIQQYALGRIREGDTELNEAYEKLIVRCSFGIINAGRNSA
jgi:phosphoenolpyruvate carboxylase